eukprot:1177336-Prorocentrum_minimum.AAC.3
MPLSPACRCCPTLYCTALYSTELYHCSCTDHRLDAYRAAAAEAGGATPQPVLYWTVSLSYGSPVGTKDGPSITSVIQSWGPRASPLIIRCTGLDWTGL